ncbi:MAG: arginine--tRNA ligase, partial [Candidatus Parcubacteria bacterium]|nr:arginine--tRNA ligase [Candidatus Parcubacteria bacterium]
VISEIKKKKLAQESQGALVVSFSDKDMPPGMLLKSDGATTYLTSDLAALKYRLKNFKPNLVIYEVGKEQDLHFKQLFKIAEMLGWLKNCELIHVAHGLFESSDGGKLSTRSGKTIYLEDVLEEAYKRTQSMISESDIKKSKIIVGKVALGALKYNDLSQHYSHNIIFDWNKILNLNGNSGPYLQYSYARAYNVLIKSKTNTKIKIKDISLDEKKILRKLSKFKEVVIESGARFSPHILCLYLFELAQLYNNFYNNYPILKAETLKKQAMRLKITKGTANIIKIGLNLLGIETLSRM